MTGSRRTYTSGYTPSYTRQREGDRSRSPQQRGPNTGAQYDRIEELSGELTAALQAFHTGPKPKWDARTPTGPMGSSTPPHSRAPKPYVKRDAGLNSRSPRRGPPSATNRCNYCESPEHFWRDCAKRVADEKLAPKVHAAKMAVCWAKEAAENDEELDDAAKSGNETSSTENDRSLESGADSSGGDSSEFDDIRGG